jgi:hypothetical protein
VDPGHVGIDLPREKSATDALAGYRQPDVNGKDTNLQYVAPFGPVHEDRTIQGMVASISGVIPFIDRV